MSSQDKSRASQHFLRFLEVYTEPYCDAQLNSGRRLDEGCNQRSDSLRFCGGHGAMGPRAVPMLTFYQRLDKVNGNITDYRSFIHRDAASCSLCFTDRVNDLKVFRIARARYFYQRSWRRPNSLPCRRALPVFDGEVLGAVQICYTRPEYFTPRGVWRGPNQYTQSKFVPVVVSSKVLFRGYRPSHS